MLAVNVSVSTEYETENGNCEDNEAETGERNVEQRETAAEYSLVT
jgi:hypothetical protein